MKYKAPLMSLHSRQQILVPIEFVSYISDVYPKCHALQSLLIKTLSGKKWLCEVCFPVL